MSRMETFLVTYAVMYRKKIKRYSCTVEAETAQKARKAISSRGSHYTPLKAESLEAR